VLTTLNQVHCNTWYTATALNSGAGLPTSGLPAQQQIRPNSTAVATVAARMAVFQLKYKRSVSLALCPSSACLRDGLNLPTDDRNLRAEF